MHVLHVPRSVKRLLDQPLRPECAAAVVCSISPVLREMPACGLDAPCVSMRTKNALSG